MTRDSVAVLIGAFIAVIAQVVIAPNIAIFAAFPNFLAAYVLVIAIVRPTNSVLVLAFVLGLLYDFLGFGPVGAMSFLLVLAAFAASRIFSYLNNDTLFMPLVILVVSMVIVEVFYAVFLIGLGLSSGVMDALLYRALPCALYDCVIALVLYPLATHFIAGGTPSGSSPVPAGTVVKSTMAPTA
ncbi:MAG: rod shape-determining protein MreD, partial [Raoultibacter sp.]